MSPHERTRTARRGALAVLTASLVTALAGVPPAGATSPIETAEIRLPDRLGNLLALDLASSYPDDVEPSPEQLQRIADAQNVNAEGFSTALGGVAVASRRYAPEELDIFYDVLAVRSELSPLTPDQFVDPEALGLAVPMQELVVIGDVNCVVRWNPVPASREATVDDRAGVACQGRRDGTTVRVSVVGAEEPREVAALVTHVLDRVT